MKIGNIVLQEDSSVTARLCLIHPLDAEQMMKRNVNNRKIRVLYVGRLAREILSGGWIPISNGIGFDIEGNLVDGQHRLLACIKSQKPIWVIVVTGLPSKAMEHSDRGIGKTLPDVLTRTGYCSDRIMVQIANFLSRNNNKDLYPSDTSVKEYIELYKDSLETVANESRARIAKFTTVGFCAAIVEAHSIYGNKAIDFMRTVKSEVGHTDRTCPALRLRMKLLGMVGAGQRIQDSTYRYTCYAFNAWIRGKKLPGVRESDQIIRPSDELEI
jgi:hypothetical protein